MRVEIDTDGAAVYCSDIPVNCEGRVRFFLHDDYGLVIAERDEARRWARKMKEERDVWQEMYGTMQKFHDAAIEHRDALRDKLRAAMFALGHSVTGLEKPADIPRNYAADDAYAMLRETSAELEAARRELAAMREQRYTATTTTDYPRDDPFQKAINSIVRMREIISGNPASVED